MESIRIIDLTGLSHDEKHEKIFPAIDSLGDGETIKIRFDFAPLPLIYMLQSRPELQVAEEKVGPKEWILRIQKQGNSTLIKDDLKKLLREMKNDNVSEETKARVKKLLEGVDAKSLGILEQELIHEGVTHEEIRKNLCDIHLEAIRDTLVAKRIEVPSPHPVHTLMEEHKVIVATLDKLQALVERLRLMNQYEEMGDDLEILKDCAHHLVEAESHHQREEEALFPRIEKHDITEPPMIMKEEHVEFLKQKRELYKIAHSGRTLPFPDFKQAVIHSGVYLSHELKSHIFKEDNILYQIALQILTPQEWEEVKKDCNKIGYCCFTPQDQCKTVDLDLRTLPPPQRHKQIFDTWRSLKNCESLRITNDHDPKPLYYQFEAEYKEQFEWKYEKQGPEDWVVRINRLEAHDNSKTDAILANAH